MIIRQYLHDQIARLNRAYIDSPATTARAVLSLAVGRPREWLVAHDDEVLEGEALAKAEGMFARVLAHEPLAYILGHREFYGLDFQVDPRVLIPRPETEMLVELALDRLKNYIPQHPLVIQEGEPAPADTPGRRWGDVAGKTLIDVGTGSGAVAIAVSVNAPEVNVIATDISPDALDVARENAARHGVSERVGFVQSDLLGRIEAQAQVVTANLPYVTVEEIEALPPEIQSHEPRVALDGGVDGLALVRRLLGQLDAHLCPGGSAFFEIGASQGQAALAAACQILPGWHTQLRADLAKLDRVLEVVKSASLQGKEV